ncbi:MAG: hypothetical protein K6F32_06690 [Bacilli bacterium]|nr:hypothetical protein [Bacilli bacterium]
MVSYKLSFSYPDGHVEDIDDIFVSLDRAAEYGDGLLNQVMATERLKRAGMSYHAKSAYYMVYECDGKTTELVYDSRED